MISNIFISKTRHFISTTVPELTGECIDNCCLFFYFFIAIIIIHKLKGKMFIFLIEYLCNIESMIK